MYEFLMQNSLYAVLIIFLIGLVGILSFLARMGNTLTSIEKKNKR
jgi:hypothetical protein